MSKQNLKYLAFGAGIVALALIFWGVASFREGSQGFSTEPLVLVAQNGARHVFNVEVAKTPSQLQQGLMYRNHMAADRGMLFLFPAEEVARMWMHNTHMPLDMLFIDRDGKIASITANARPFDDTPISSHVPVHAALEINGGMAQTLGIGVGGEVESESLKRFLQ